MYGKIPASAHQPQKHDARWNVFNPYEYVCFIIMFLASIRYFLRNIITPNQNSPQPHKFIRAKKCSYKFMKEETPGQRQLIYTWKRAVTVYRMLSYKIYFLVQRRTDRCTLWKKSISNVFIIYISTNMCLKTTSLSWFFPEIQKGFFSLIFRFHYYFKIIDI